MLNSLTTKPRNWDESEYIMVQYFKLIGLALVLSVGMGSRASSNSVDVVNEVTELEFSYLNNIPKGPILIDFRVGLGPILGIRFGTISAQERPRCAQEGHQEP